MWARCIDASGKAFWYFLDKLHSNTPTPTATTIGTCVNVGCVPKKICHYGGLLGEAMKDAKKLGWRIEKWPEVRLVDLAVSVKGAGRKGRQLSYLRVVTHSPTPISRLPPQHEWADLAGAVRDHRGMLNFVYRRGLKSAKVRQGVSAQHSIGMMGDERPNDMTTGGSGAERPQG